MFLPKCYVKAVHDTLLVEGAMLMYKYIVPLAALGGHNTCVN